MKSPTGQACKKQHVALAEDELLGRHDVLALERVERDPDDERCVRASERYRASCTHKHETVRERKNPTPAPHIAFARTEREREPRVVLVLVVDQQVVDVPSVESHIFTPAAHCVRPCLHWAGGGKKQYERHLCLSGLSVAISTASLITLYPMHVLSFEFERRRARDDERRARGGRGWSSKSVARE